MTLIVNLKKDALEAFYPRARRPETRSLQLSCSRRATDSDLAQNL